MSTFVLMRLLESAPRRYDLGIQLLSLGQLRKAHERMAEQANPGERVLDIGCGTGSLTLLCAARGGEVTGIDISLQMLDIARTKVAVAGLEERVELMEMSAVDLDDEFSAQTFDVVVSSLVFSELSDDERRFTLRECHRLLRDGGRLVVADEVVPRSWPLRLLSRVLRFPLVALTYILTQTTTQAVPDLEGTIADAGFAVRSAEHSLLGGLEVIVAEKREDG